MEQAIPWMEGVVELLHRNPREATDTLMEFRKEPHALDASQAILAGSQNPQAQYHAVQTLQEVGLQRWTGLSHEARKHLLRICWEKVLSTPGGGLESFVRNALLQACAVFWKRGWSGTVAAGGGVGAASDAADGWGEQTKAELLAGLASLSGDAGHVVEVADMLGAVVVEFSSSRNNRSAAMGLPLEFHRAAHNEFEKNGLEATLQLGMDMLARSVAEWQGQGAHDPATLEARHARLKASVTLCNSLLEWEHGWLDVWSIPAPNKAVRPPESWRPYLIRPDLLGGLFQVYHTTRFVDINIALTKVEQGHKYTAPNQGSSMPVERAIRIFLSMAALITGRIFSDEAERTAYAGFMVEGTLQIIANPSGTAPEVATVKARAAQYMAMQQPQQGAHLMAPVAEAGLVSQVDTYLSQLAEDEMSGVTDLVSRLVSNFSFKTLAPMADFGALCHRLAKVTASLLQSAATQAQQVGAIDYMINQEPWELRGARTLLDAWCLLCSHPSFDNPEFAAAAACLREIAAPLFDEYVRCRVSISRSEGFQEVLAQEEFDLDIEDSESEALNEEITNAAVVGRLCLTSSLPMLMERLTGGAGGAEPTQPSIMHRLAQPIAANAGGGGGGSVGGGGEVCPAAASMLEEARVVVLISGRLLAFDSSSGEEAGIPPEIMHACASTDSMSEAVVGLTTAVLQVMEQELNLLSSHAVQELRSAFLAETLVEYATHWAASYLEPDTGAQAHRAFEQPRCRALVEAYTVPAGCDPQTLATLPAAQHAQLLLKAAGEYLAKWPFEHGLVKNVCGLLGALLKPLRTSETSKLLHLLNGVGAAELEGVDPAEVLIPVASRLPEFDALVIAHGSSGRNGFPGVLEADQRRDLMEVMVAGALAVIPSSEALKDAQSGAVFKMI